MKGFERNCELELTADTGWIRLNTRRSNDGRREDFIIRGDQVEEIGVNKLGPSLYGDSFHIKLKERIDGRSNLNFRCQRAAMATDSAMSCERIVEKLGQLVGVTTIP